MARASVADGRGGHRMYLALAVLTWVGQWWQVTEEGANLCRVVVLELSYVLPRHGVSVLMAGVVLGRRGATA